MIINLIVIIFHFIKFSIQYSICFSFVHLYILIYNIFLFLKLYLYVVSNKIMYMNNFFRYNDLFICLYSYFHTFQIFTNK